jgi:hypothetical protein
MFSCGVPPSDDLFFLCKSAMFASCSLDAYYASAKCALTGRIELGCDATEPTDPLTPSTLAHLSGKHGQALREFPRKTTRRLPPRSQYTGKIRVVTTPAMIYDAACSTFFLVVGTETSFAHTGRIALTPHACQH